MAGLDAGACDAPFADRASLTARGVATELPERAGDLAALREALAPSRDGSGAVGASVYGPSGSGKTELALQCGREFEAAGGTLLHLDCGVDDTEFSCCRRIANELGDELPASGLSVDRARRRAIERVRAAPTPVCVVLDDVDRLEDDVRRALLLEVVDRPGEAAVGTIATSGSLAHRNSLGPRELAVVGDTERVLAPYGREALRAIVERRSRRAFQDCAVDDGVLEAAVEAALERGGDAGYALDVLATAGELARDGGATSLGRTHLERARDQVRVDALVERIGTLRDHHRFALRGLCDLARNAATPARVGAVFGAYVDACEQAGVEPNTERSLQNYLGRLVETGLLEVEEVRTDAGGKFNRYGLGRDADAVDVALQAVA